MASTAPASASRSPRSSTTCIIACRATCTSSTRCRALAARRARLRGRRPAALAPARRRPPRRHCRRGRTSSLLHATSRADKLWPEAHWRALIDALRRAPASRRCCRGAARTRRRAAGGSPMASRRAIVPPRLSLPRCSPRCSRARELVVGVDTGLHASRRGARHADGRALHRHRPAPRRRRAAPGRTRATSAATGVVPVARRRACARAGELLRARRAADRDDARALYTLLWWLALPLLPLRLWWRGRREPGYRDAHRRALRPLPRRRAAARERRGLDPRGVARRNARGGAADRAPARASVPRRTILLTHMTATGREAGRALFGDRVVQAWLPYDVPFAVRAFLAHFRPRAGLLMETELWPNLAARCARARACRCSWSTRACRSGRRAATRASRRCRGRCSRRSPASPRRPTPMRRACAALGARDVAVTGNLKFDVDVPARRARAGPRAARSASARRGRCGSRRRRATARRR